MISAGVYFFFYNICASYIYIPKVVLLFNLRHPRYFKPATSIPKGKLVAPGILIGFGVALAAKHDFSIPIFSGVPYRVSVKCLLDHLFFLVGGPRVAGVLTGRVMWLAGRIGSR